MTAAPRTIPFAQPIDLGGSDGRAFPNPFLDDFEEVVAGTKYKSGELHGVISNRGVEACQERVFPSSEKRFPRKI